ncbi:MAG: response regulator [Pedobacter sp.]|nr:MAG: response regulator [Pedobacter sp.]
MRNDDTNINWAKQALTFIAKVSVYEGYQDWFSILQLSMANLKYLSGAEEVKLIKYEDELTISLFGIGTLKNAPKYVDPRTFKLFSQQTTPLFLDDMSTLGKYVDVFSNPQTVVVFPIEEINVTGYIILTWQKPFDLSADFKEFSNACLVKIRETIRLTQIYYSLEELKVRFNAILQTIPQGVVFIDDSGKNSWVNEPAAKLLSIEGGHVAPTLLSMAMNQFRAKANNKAEILQKGLEIFKSAEKKIEDWKWIFSDPVPFILNVCCTPTISEYVSGMLWTFEDVTQQYLYDERLKDLNIQLEEKSRLANEQNRAKSEFLANMSHEIRTPMNGVIGMTSLLRNTSLSEDQIDFVESIRISADALLEIINEILDFSKIESGKLELEEHPFFLHKIVEETYDLLSFKAREKNLDLLYIIEPNVPTEVIGDMTRLRQIVVNLVGNAIKFTDEGEILTRISLISEENENYVLEFSVRDSGIGIPQNKMHKLFDSFSQVDSSTTRKYGGTGLGLAISARLVEKMNGRIWVESEVGVGTTFKYTIQIKAKKETEKYKSTALKKDLLGRSVLIIDDNLTNLKILKGHCEHWGMDADTFENGGQAFAALKKKHYDIAVIDLLMPEVNGIDVAKQISKKYKHIPLVLFTSAGSFPEDRKKDKKLFSAIIDKPIKPLSFHKMLIDTLTTVEERSVNPVSAEKSDVLRPMLDDTVRILVAEDNLINQKIVTNAFKNIGYSCDVVSNGLEVISSLQRQQYDIVMMDVHMPEMDGLQATREVIEMFADERPIIIAMTAGAYEEDREDCLRAGMDDYITKPFDFETLYYKFDYWKGKIRK